MKTAITTTAPFAILATVGTPETVPGIALVEHWNGVLLIIAATLMCTGAIQGVTDGVAARYPFDVDDNLAARRIQTQTKLLARTAKGAERPSRGRMRIRGGGIAAARRYNGEAPARRPPAGRHPLPVQR